jgi:hypothetical protein
MGTKLRIAIMLAIPCVLFSFPQQSRLMLRQHPDSRMIPLLRALRGGFDQGEDWDREGEVRTCFM